MHSIYGYNFHPIRVPPGVNRLKNVSMFLSHAHTEITLINYRKYK